jgi:hypothetical protein
MNLMSAHLSSTKTKMVMVILFLGMLLNSCKKDKLTPPTNVGTIRFAANSYTIENNTIDPLMVTLPLSLPLEQDATAVITVDGSSTIGTAEYTVTPAIPPAGLTLNLPKGATEVSFNVSSLNNFEGEKTLVLKLTSATGGLTVAKADATTTINIKGNPIILPEIKASESSIAFGSTVTTTTSPSKTYVVTGVKLTSNLIITASTNFQVSLDDVTFNSSLTIPFATANAAPITVYTRFRALTGINQTVNGTITNSSGILPDAVVSTSGVEYGVAAPGVLLKAENFSYGASGALTTVSAGAWVPFSQSLVNPIQYLATGLNYPGYVGSGVGGALVTSNYSGNAEDSSWNIPSTSSGVIYAAQLMNFTSAPATTADFFYSFGDGASTTTPLYFNRFYAKASGSQIALGLSRNATTTPAYATLLLDVGTTYLVVTKYDFGSGSSSTYILAGAPPIIEPATANIISTGGSANPSAITRMAVRQSTNLPLKVTIDGIRVATSWKEAVGL